MPFDDLTPFFNYSLKLKAKTPQRLRGYVQQPDGDLC
jgi:hypothetical protein